jgi:hypothetical protein
MSEATTQRLGLLAERASDSGRKVGPMQIAAQILEAALAGMREQMMGHWPRLLGAVPIVARILSASFSRSSPGSFQTI